jgi:hypothetical protein
MSTEAQTKHVDLSEHLQQKKTQKVSVHNLYDAYSSYLRALDFYKEEIQYLQKRLDDIAKANTGNEIMKEVEQFQNQFFITQDNLHDLKHHIQKALENIEQLIKQKPTHTDEKTILYLGIYGRNVHDLEKSFAVMKLGFNEFLAKYL